jgi:hypothetical protein
LFPHLENFKSTQAAASDEAAAAWSLENRRAFMEHTHSHSLFAAVAPLAASKFKKNFRKSYMWFKQGRSNGRIA